MVSCHPSWAIIDASLHARRHGQSEYARCLKNTPYFQFGIQIYLPPHLAFALVSAGCQRAGFMGRSLVVPTMGMMCALAKERPLCENWPSRNFTQPCANLTEFLRDARLNDARCGRG
jgi:hypothetical protein